MSRLKKNMGRRILAYVLSGAMIMSNMTAFASEPSKDTGSGYYEEVADDSESTDVEERADHAAETKEESKSEGSNSSGKDDVQASSVVIADETVEETEVKDSEQAAETKASDEEQASETKSSLSAEKEETESAKAEEKEKSVSEKDNKTGEFYDGLAASTVESGKSYYYDFTPDTFKGIPNNYTNGLFSFYAGKSNAATYKDSKYGIQFKAGNELTFQVSGDSYIVVGGDNNNNCTDLAATSTSGKLKPTTNQTETTGHASLDDCKQKGSNTLIYGYTGDEGSVTLTVSNGSAYIAYVCIIPKEKVKVSGSVNATPAIGSDCKVVFTDKADNTVFVEFDVTNNSYEANLCAGSTYTVKLSDETYSVTTEPAGGEITIEEGDSAKTLNITASKLTTTKVEGDIKGDIPEGLELVFTEQCAEGETPHTPTVTIEGGKYTVNLKEGATYDITAEAANINDYEFSPKELDTTGKKITFTKKTEYNVTVTISTFNHEEIERPEITFTNVNEEGYTYTLKKTDESRALRNGTYSISMDVEYPYVFDFSKTFEVKDSDKALTLDFAERMTWDFTDAADKALTKMTYQQGEVNNQPESEHPYNGLIIDTHILDDGSYGKFDVFVGQYVQVNVTTKIKIPVSGTGLVKITTYNSTDKEHYRIIGHEEIANGQTCSWAYDNPEDGYVTLEAVTQFCLKQIIVTRDEQQGGEEDENDCRREWDFTNNDKGEWTGISIEGTRDTIAGNMKIGAVEGKFAYRPDNGDVQVSARTEILVPVKGDSKITITISSNPNDTNTYEVGEKEIQNATSKEQTFTVTGEGIRTGTTGTDNKPVKWIPIWVTGGQIFLQKIVVVPLAAEIPKPEDLDTTHIAVWDFNADVLDTDKYYNMLTAADLNNAIVGVASDGQFKSSFIINKDDEEKYFEYSSKVQGSEKNTRLYADNTLLDSSKLAGENQKWFSGVCKGALYVNAESPDPYISIYAKAGDVIQIVAGGNNDDSIIAFEQMDGTDKTTATAAKLGATLTFYAAADGQYKIYSENEKLVVGRITREHKDNVKVTGTVDAPASLTKSYSVAFKCRETGVTNVI